MLRRNGASFLQGLQSVHDTKIIRGERETKPSSAIAALINGIEQARKDLSSLNQKMTERTAELEHAKKLQKLCRELAFASGIVCTVPEENSSPWICHLNLKKHEGAVVVRLLGNEGICVGSGTACSAETGKPSAALISLGFRQKEAFGGLRISFSPSTNLYDVKKLFEVLEKTLKNY